MDSQKWHGTSIALLALLVLLGSCIKDRDFSAPKDSCIQVPTANASYDDIKRLYFDETIQIQEDYIIEGYVSSSDQSGNFFSVLYFQDSPTEPKEGFQIELDLRDSHLFFPVGQRIFIKTQGLYLGKSRGVYKLGGVFNAFGNITVGRLPATAVTEHVFTSCDKAYSMRPISVNIADLKEANTHILVKLNGVEVVAEEIAASFAIEGEETVRTLLDCNDNEIGLVNSGFSDFFDVALPSGNGSMVGVLLRENKDFFIAIRDLGDVNLTGERCQDVIDQFTSDDVFISELADPNNDPDARFVELFNAGNEPLPLKGWQLIRYTNDNTEVSSSIDLSGHILQAQSAFVISPNIEAFVDAYGFEPNFEAGTNSPADSNGDDNLFLIDPFGKVIDAYGRIGEDGTGTDHEFEDGRALRNLEVVEGNSVFDNEEWTIYNDSGGNGTINLPQDAPQDFSPGLRE